MLYEVITQYAGITSSMRNEMLTWMKRTGDPALVALENRKSSQALKQFMANDPLKPNAGIIQKKKRGDNKRKRD